MKIKMTQSIPGSIDGVTVIDLVAGREYDTVDTARGTRLALSHIRKGVAVAVEVLAPAVELAQDTAAPAPMPKTNRKLVPAK
ncbi:MAG: hypothetical protein RR376_08055 [Janthinobacterium sp.]